MPQPASCLLALLRGALNGQAVPALPQETDEAALLHLARRHGRRRAAGHAEKRGRCRRF